MIFAFKSMDRLIPTLGFVRISFAGLGEIATNE